mgnify:FL=1
MAGLSAAGRGARPEVAAIVVGGGGGQRLGGVSKPDLVLGGVRLIDRVCAALTGACGAGCVAVVPPAVRVPDGVARTLEDPPGGGPLAGIDAGLSALNLGEGGLAVVVSVDAPGVGEFVPLLLAEPLGEAADGRIVRGGEPEPFDQYLMGVYRVASLRRAIDEAVAALGSVRGVGVRRVLRSLALERVEVDALACRDVDTPEDLAWWEARLTRALPRENADYDGRSGASR